jgi:hypothetical protein
MAAVRNFLTDFRIIIPYELLQILSLKSDKHNVLKSSDAGKIWSLYETAPYSGARYE